MLDFETINQYALASYPGILEEWLPGGKLSGYEYRCGDLSGGAGDSLGVNIKTGKWADFAADASGGDPISLYAAIKIIGQGEAARELADRFSIDTSPPPKPKKQEKRGPWTPIIPVPLDAPAPPDEYSRKNKETNEWEKLPLVKRWTYRDAEGRIIGHVARFEKPEGGKEIVPQTFCEQDGKRRWKWLSFPQPRPLYGLDRLVHRPKSSVIVTEGEKCADALQAELDAAGMPFVVVSWPGGGKAAGRAEWSPLAGRKIVIWPDNDEPGIAAALNIAGLLPPDCLVKIIRPPGGDKPKGWDCADAIADGWDAAACIEFLKSRLCDPSELAEDAQPPLPDEPPENTGNDSSPELDHESAADQVDPDRWTLDGAPFQILGYDHGSYYYLPNGTRQVVELTASGHTGQNLTALAPLQWWEKKFPGKQGVNWNTATNAMLRSCERRGVYDSRRIRGRGAWEDNGRSVLHLGDRLIVDGQTAGIEELKTGHIYEAAAPMDQGVDAKPVSTPDANKFAALCDMLTWEAPINGRLLAGWCVVAPICGALRWRPHIWVTGPAGCGKSWVMDNVLAPAVGPAALAVQSNTTEAGLRQELKHDARPVLFDEAEGEDKEAQRRIQNVLELMRQASTENGAAILKGSASGKAMSFRIRSAFAFSSIGVSAFQQADLSRITVLALLRNQSPDRDEQFRHLQRSCHKTLTPEYLSGLRARSVLLLPVICRNAEIFSRAAAGHLGSKRLGDQLGALLAGAYSLYSTNEISDDDAKKWVAQQDWGEVVDEQDTRDESRCLERILGHIIRVQGSHASHDLTIEEIIRAAACSYRLFDDIAAKDAFDLLRRYGIRVDRETDSFIISRTYHAIGEILSGTPWNKTWARILARVDGAEVSKPVKFPGKSRAERGISIPLRYVEE